MKSIIRKTAGFTLAGIGCLAALLSLYQIFTTGNLQWLILAIPSAGFTVAGFILAYGSVRDFIDAVLDVFQMIP